ncbi:MAG: antibiotic biosynthesis monooxygenase [Sphingopyxis sp.]|uniref:putative quinol monooxygenase n=1 Tax=Sphingopyxis sp. TaxID=1908224 RepID=UPI002ABA27CC|nr:antibiotic biosynthesis monooxygenase [Sphingopyxis sp.]MDZ3830462.1 antibiotic biosynthesis monooxygenase [Sphingopyxis sp.]
MIDRRQHMAALLAMAAMFVPTRKVQALEMRMEEVNPEFGLIGQMIAKPGQRAALAAILTEGTNEMPGNMGYLVGEDSANSDALWVVELWETQEAHTASLQHPAVRAAIAKGRPLIAAFGTRVEFKPVAKTAK